MAAPALCVAILVGGQSRRMGQDKAGMRLGDRTLLEHVLAAAAPLSAERLLVAGQAGAGTDAGLPVCVDLYPQAGPLGGLCTALAGARAGRVLLLACDLPLLTTPLLGHLVDCLGGHEALVPHDADGLHPLCAVYRRSCLETARQVLSTGGRRMTDLLGRLDVRYLERKDWGHLDPSGHALFNANTPADLDLARSLLAAGCPPLAGEHR
ncbi:MAG: molybdenum cofactor guanylyltransferase [Candidatus Latescibacterota bacterium]